MTVHDSGAGELGELTTQVLQVTADHPIWSLDDGTWDEAGKLELGEQVDALHGPMWLVTAVESPVAATVYNFEVADSHTYFVGEAGVWAHNSKNCFVRLGAAGRLRNAISGEFVSKQTAQDAWHIFRPKILAKHRLGGFLASFGGNAIKATRAIHSATQRLADSGGWSGQFGDKTVIVNGTSLVVRGTVMDGVVKLGTAFIPPS